MKKAHQFLLKSFVLVIAISFALLSFVGCKNSTDISNNSNPSNVSTTQTISGDNNKDNTADYVNDGDTSVPPAVLYEVKSIYSYAKNPSFNNVTYDNLEGVLKFFKTRDMNGVHKAAKKLGFDTFIAKQFIIDAEPVDYYVSIDGTETPIYTTFIQNEFGNFVMLDENKFNYELVKNIYINKDGNYVLQIQFTYINDAGETIETPLMINLELTKVATYIVK